MLNAYTVRSPASGQVAISVIANETVGTGTILARVTPKDGRPLEIRSAFAGTVGRILTRDGSWVAEGADIVSVDSGEEQVWEALRGLYLIGEAEDLVLVQRFASASNVSDLVRKQAALSAQAIRARLEPKPTR